MKSVWSKMSWKEITEARARKPVVLVPIGTVETHGPHTFIGLETHLAEELARRAADATSSLVVPVIPFGYSESFTGFPGTISVRPEVLTELYYDTISSIIRSGFDHVLLVANHIPNQPMIEHAAARIRRDEGVLIAWVNPQTMAAGFLKEAFEDPAAVRGHGAEPGLSLAAYLDPQAVDLGALATIPVPREFRGTPIQGMSMIVGGRAIGFPIQMADIAAEHGGYGNPTQANVRAGEIMFSRLLDYLVELIGWFGVLDTRDGPVAGRAAVEVAR
jgi:creatinine amidohydrolase